MAATYADDKLDAAASDECGKLYISQTTVTFTAVDTVAWRTRLSKILYYGVETVSGTGVDAGGPSVSGTVMTVNCTASDVIKLWAIGYL